MSRRRSEDRVVITEPEATNCFSINKKSVSRPNSQVYKLGFSSILFEEIRNRQTGYASEAKI